MKLIVNGDAQEVEAATLAQVLETLGHHGTTVATAVNGDFVAAVAREKTTLSDGDRVEILAPRQGG